MNKEDINKDNILIAEFMGLKQIKGLGWYDEKMLLTQIVYDVQGGNYFDTLLFHKDWNWLISTVEQIWKYVGNRNSLFYFDNEEDCRIFPNVNHVNNIEDCYKAVIKFIHWYNKNKQDE